MSGRHPCLRIWEAQLSIARKSVGDVRGDWYVMLERQKASEVVATLESRSVGSTINLVAK